MHGGAGVGAHRFRIIFAGLGDEDFNDVVFDKVPGTCD